MDLRRINDVIVDQSNNILGSAPFFWFCVVLVTLPLFVPKLMDLTQFLSSGVIQLLALPLLGISAKKSQEKHAQHAEAIQVLHSKVDGIDRNL
jgi:hypothetical protein